MTLILGGRLTESSLRVRLPPGLSNNAGSTSEHFRFTALGPSGMVARLNNLNMTGRTCRSPDWSRALCLTVVQHGFGDGHETCVVGAAVTLTVRYTPRFGPIGALIDRAVRGSITRSQRRSARAFAALVAHENPTS